MVISEEYYLEAVSRLLLPSSVIATGRSKKEAQSDTFTWINRCASHDHWRLRTSDEQLLKDPDVYADFSAALEFTYGKSVLHPPYHDALTKRIFCIEVLNNTAVPRRAGASPAIKLLNNFDWIIRARNSYDITCFRDLTQDHIDQSKLDNVSADIMSTLPFALWLNILL